MCWCCARCRRPAASRSAWRRCSRTPAGASRDRRCAPGRRQSTRLRRRSRSGRCSGCGSCPATGRWHSSGQQTGPPSRRPIAPEPRRCCSPTAAAVPAAPAVRSIALRRRSTRPTPAVGAGSDMPILMLTAADRLDDKATGFELGADDYLTKPFELRELVLRLRALDRRRAHNRPPVREIAGLRLDPFRREVYRDGRYVALTRKQSAVLEVLVAADGGVVSAEELLARAWDQNADPFTNAVRITVSALRKRLGEPWIIATVPGAGYRIDTRPDSGREGGDRG